MRKLIKERMENKVVNFVGFNKVVLGINGKGENNIDEPYYQKTLTNRKKGKKESKKWLTTL